MSVLRLLFALVLIASVAACATPPQPSPKAGIKSSAPPTGFVDLKNLAPTAVLDMRYFGQQNFMQRPVAGYEKARCLMRRSAAEALSRVQADLEKWGLALLIFDCYRPQRAVNDFLAWARDLSHQSSKAEYYPRVEKSRLFAEGYLAEKSGHSRGSTVDLSLWVLDAEKARAVLKGPLSDQTAVDMGTPFDFFDPLSHTGSTSVDAAAQHNRRWLKQMLEQQGFVNLPEEWWHFTHQPEPLPEQFFDFPIQ